MMPRTYSSVMGGKASILDHLWPENFDHPKSELHPCNIVLYLKDNMAG